MHQYVWKIKGETPKKSMKKSKKERNMIPNRNLNPFFKKDNYLHDLSVQDKFLRPKDSNIEK